MLIRRNQSGFALLLFVLLLLSLAGLIGTGYIKQTLLEIEKKETSDTQHALETAKFALLQYAYNYPDFSPTNGGPGRLPCPDSDNDGDAENVLNCGSGLAGFTMIGRFPYLQTGLNVEDLRDSSNSRLWYAVSHSFSWQKGAPNIINAASEGTISLSDVTGSIINDSSSDGGGIVAVIIAPGEKITRYEPGPYTQVRTTAAQQVDSRNYLEVAFGIDNTTFEFGDRNSATGVNDVNGFIKGPIYDSNRKAIISNDQFITITREEITKFALKRAAEEIQSVLSDYQNEFTPSISTYPWLYDDNYADPQFDFSDPSGDLYNMQAFANRADKTRPTEKGFLPVLTDGQRYSTEIRFKWKLNPALPVSNNGLGEILLTDLSQFEGFSESLQSDYTVDQCIWRNNAAVSCNFAYTKTVWYEEVDAVINPDVWTLCALTLQSDCAPGIPVRSYTLTVGNTLSFQNNEPTNLQKNAATSNSLDEVEMKFRFTGGNTRLADLLTDVLSLYPVRLDIKQYLNNTATVTIEEAFIDIAALAGGVYSPLSEDYVSLTTRFYPADSWFADNEWNQFMLLEYSNSLKPGGAATPCSADCITLDDYSVFNRKIDAIALFSGEQKKNTGYWPSTFSIDYFEEDNLVDDQSYSLDSIDINDIIKVIAP